MDSTAAEEKVVVDQCCQDCQRHLTALVEYFRGPMNDPWGEFLLGQSPQQMKLAAANGCHLCSLKEHDWRVARAYTGTLDIFGDRRRCGLPDIDDSTVENDATVLHVRGETTIKMNYSLRSPVDDEPERSKRVLGRPESFAQLIAIPTRNLEDESHRFRLPSLSPYGNATIKMASSWMRECVATHIDCQKKVDLSGSRPSRLIDIGMPSLRLRDTAEMDTNAHYMALSHCWGKVQPICLTSQNKGTLYDGIALMDLPLLFQEVVQVAQKLDFSFLWIDCLCIQQDSREDWEHESARMGDIFLGARCVIAAVSAKDSSYSLFQGRNPLKATAFHYGSGDAEEDLTITYWHSTNVLHARDWKNTTRPLLNRGWVAQEKSLAARVLAFGEGTMSWSCVCAIGSESRPQLSRNPIDEFEQQLLDFGDNLTKVQLFPKHSKFLLAWHRHVQSFTRCDLTFPTDRVPAIDGMIKVISRLTKLESCCGIWRDYLAWELLWHRAEKPLVQTINNGEPSWSWTSIDSAVKWADGNDGGLLPGLEVRAESISLTRSQRDSQNNLDLIVRATSKKWPADRACNPRTCVSTLDSETTSATHARMLFIMTETLPDKKRAARGLLIEPVTWPVDGWRRIGYFSCRECFNDVIAEGGIVETFHLI